jgi:DNA polymerase-4
MDAFFASVEQRDNPNLRGKPVLVGGTGNRGVVAAASYEARVFGCHSAMPMVRAKRLCPQAIVVSGSHQKYRQVSRQVFDIFGRFTDLVQPLSVDEAFLDVSGCLRLFGSGEKIARDIRTAIQRETQLTASVGVAPNKFLAKLASDLNKPDGLTVITPEAIDTILPPLPITRIWGIGGKTAARLHGLGMRTFADLRRMDAAWFAQHLGSWGPRVRELIHGIDTRPVETDDQAKSIGQEQTFGVDLTDPDYVREVLLQQAEAVGERVRRQGVCAGRVTVKIRFGDFQTITRSHTLSSPTELTRDIYIAATDLFDQWANQQFQPVRLIGLQTSQFTREAQLDLFEHAAQERLRKVDQAVDAIKARFGSTAIGRGAKDHHDR